MATFDDTPSVPPMDSPSKPEMDKENVTKFRNMNGVVVDVLTTTTT